MNPDAWNAGVCLAFLCLMCWWRSDGKVWWQNLNAECRECGRAKASCSCVDVVFTPWDEDDE